MCTLAWTRVCVFVALFPGLKSRLKKGVVALLVSVPLRITMATVTATDVVTLNHYF